MPDASLSRKRQETSVFRVSELFFHAYGQFRLAYDPIAGHHRSFPPSSWLIFDRQNALLVPPRWQRSGLRRIVYQRRVQDVYRFVDHAIVLAAGGCGGSGQARTEEGSSVSIRLCMQRDSDGSAVARENLSGPEWGAIVLRGVAPVAAARNSRTSEAFKASDV